MTKKQKLVCKYIPHQDTKVNMNISKIDTVSMYQSYL
jgi:hypothetical protein